MVFSARNGPDKTEYEVRVCVSVALANFRHYNKVAVPQLDLITALPLKDKYTLNSSHAIPSTGIDHTLSIVSLLLQSRYGDKLFGVLG